MIAALAHATPATQVSPRDDCSLMDSSLSPARSTPREVDGTTARRDTTRVGEAAKGRDRSSGDSGGKVPAAPEDQAGAVTKMSAHQPQTYSMRASSCVKLGYVSVSERRCWRAATPTDTLELTR